MDTITNNEDYVRLRIYEGDLKIDEAAAELLRIERAQHEATRKEMLRFRAECGRLADELFKAKGATDGAACHWSMWPQTEEKGA